MSPIYGSFKIENMSLVLFSVSGLSSPSGVFTLMHFVEKNSNLPIKKSSGIAVFLWHGGNNFEIFVDK